MSGQVLVVDDNPVNRKLAVACATRLGWQASEVESGAQALALLEIQRFDVILLDISMPGMSGEEVLGHLRADPRLCDLRVVAYTAHALPEEHERFRAAGFNGLLIKPVSLKSLEAALGMPGRS